MPLHTDPISSPLIYTHRMLFYNSNSSFFPRKTGGGFPHLFLPCRSRLLEKYLTPTQTLSFIYHPQYLLGKSKQQKNYLLNKTIGALTNTRNACIENNFPIIILSPLQVYFGESFRGKKPSKLQHAPFPASRHLSFKLSRPANKPLTSQN